jgi:hypothetical protein
MMNPSGRLPSGRLFAAVDVALDVGDQSPRPDELPAQAAFPDATGPRHRLGAGSKAGIEQQWLKHQSLPFR